MCDTKDITRSGERYIHRDILYWQKSTYKALRNLNLVLCDHDEMFLIWREFVKIAHVFRRGEFASR
jgi:hypothetical protein